jgi:hypothetical protein
MEHKMENCKVHFSSIKMLFLTLLLLMLGLITTLRQSLKTMK